VVEGPVGTGPSGSGRECLGKGGGKMLPNGALVVVVIALQLMQLILASIQKRVAAEGTVLGYGRGCRWRQINFYCSQIT